jgi:transcriptional regulator with XRE-family HTH domain
MLDAVIVGNVIQRFREQKKQSQELVSGFAGIGRTHLSAIERGERKPTLDTFFKIADALGVKPSIIIAAIEEELEKK